MKKMFKNSFGNIKYYKYFENKEMYCYSTQQSKKRLEFFKKYVYQKIKKYLFSPILDFGCGAGLFTFFLEKEGYNVIGVDINDEMIKIAKKIKSKYKFNSLIYKKDLTVETIDIKFKTFLCIGNTLWDINLYELKNILSNVKASYYIFDFIDNFSLIKNKKWKLILKENIGNGTYIILTFKKNLKEKKIKRLFIGKKIFIATHWIWSRNILKNLLEELKLKEIKTFSLSNNRFISIFRK